MVLNDYTIVALKRGIEVDRYTLSAPDVDMAIDIAELRFIKRNISYDDVVSISE